ncbi:MAG: metallophosphoesterase family protein [Bacteroidetes bacterium]|nr:metallophosphoesterase family protein [Bacteroidota bacterium]MBS1756417.1 metallophosphoesterase family protein [Bacteroidota bacterium]
MTSIGLISDTHGYLDPAIFEHFKNCDEVWHAGDFGDMELVKKLQGFKPLRGVYGNIDDKAIRNIFEEKLFFTCEEVPVMMQHIGGYPGRYAPGVKKEIILQHSQLFISGHSHILKVMYDDGLQCLHINPGAAGKQGWHTVRTIIRFAIDKKDIKNCEVIELGSR